MIIDNKVIIKYFSDLPKLKQNNLLKDLGKVKLDTDCFKVLRLRGDALDNHRAECPHCQSGHYIKNGTDKGSRRYKCKECKRGFTEYKGTWVAGLHKKENI
jgi:DNA-directed RNA polymerase subunit RPC12/RpoP